jgi:hypothetical protein
VPDDVPRRLYSEKVNVAFSVDGCARKAIHFVATREPLTQKHIAELMIFSADKRSHNRTAANLMLTVT